MSDDVLDPFGYYGMFPRLPLTMWAPTGVPITYEVDYEALAKFVTEYMDGQSVEGDGEEGG